MVSTTLKVLGWIYFVINLLLAEMVAHGLHKVWQTFPNNLYWSTRRTTILKAILIVTIVFILVERNLQLFMHSLQLFDPPYWFPYFLNNAFLITLLTLYGVRAWIIHWDYSVGLAMYCKLTNSYSERNLEWDWFLSHHSTYGSPRYLLQFAVSGILAFNLILLISSLVSPDANPVFVGAIYLIIGAILINITLKIKNIEDSFFIGDELIREFRVMAIASVILGILVLVGPYLGWQWALFFAVETTTIGAAVCGLFSTWWVNFSIEFAHRKVPPSDTIQQVFDNAKYLHGFAQFLIKELSLENLFFLSDIVQYKKSFVVEGHFDIAPGWSELVPLDFSQIDCEGYKLLERADWLIYRYLSGKTAFYITALDEKDRDAVIDGFDTLKKQFNINNEEDVKQLVVLFDNVANQVFVALQDSFKRFSITQQYRKLMRS